VLSPGSTLSVPLSVPLSVYQRPSHKLTAYTFNLLYMSLSPSLSLSLSHALSACSLAGAAPPEAFYRDSLYVSICRELGLGVKLELLQR
jgi:hypothetical protein